VNDTVQLSTEAWLARGNSGIPGQLSLSGGRLSFVAAGRGTAWKWQLKKLGRTLGDPGLADRLCAGESVAIFDVALSRLEVEFPWYYFASGLKVRFEGTLFKIGFIGPPTELPVHHSNVLKSLSKARRDLKRIRQCLRSYKTWKAALTGASTHEG
jgi:hypothetical protein